jgi:hypothetical protein
VVLCRNETRSGKRFPHEAHPSNDPRCVSIYELEPGKKEPTRIARHDELAWHQYAILAIPDGSGFIVNGLKTGDIHSREVIAFSSTADKIEWRLSLPDSPGEGNVSIDLTGTVVTYWAPPDQPRQFTPPYREGAAMSANKDETLLLAGEMVQMSPANRPNGIHLAKPGAASPFLTLSPDDHIPGNSFVFTSDGRHVVWGTEDGIVHVGDLPQIRRLLVEAGFPGW